MSEIRIKATNKKTSDGYTILEKQGNLDFDFYKDSKDCVHIHTIHDVKIGIDFDSKTKEFRIFFDDKNFKKFNN